MKVKQDCKAELQIAASDIARLAKDQLRRLLVDADAKSVSVALTVRVPGGGDWSNMDLDLEDCPVQCVVTWTQTLEVP